MWIDRTFSKKIALQNTFKPIILVTGARQVGKSSLLKRLFPQANYVNFDRASVAADAESNPNSFLKSLGTTAILDEIQYVPSLLREIKYIIDSDESKSIRYYLTGSQRLEVMQGVTESLAGRVSIFDLDSLSPAELRSANIPNDTMVQRGGYPELWASPGQTSKQFYDDYVTSYLERDVRSMIQIESLRTFDRFLRAVALRVGSLVNYSAIAKDIGISSNTVNKWTQVLAATNIISIVEPYFTNQSKRLIKTPKIYFRDNGILCHLLRAYEEDPWREHIMAGKIWENFVYGTLLRECIQLGYQRGIHFWQEKSRGEIDFLVEHGNTVTLIEAKAAENPTVSDLNFGLFIKHYPKVKTRLIVACPNALQSSYLTPEIQSINPLFSNLIVLNPAKDQQLD